MKKRYKLLLALLVLIAAIGYFNYPKLNIISGYASKNLASSIFIANRSAESVVAADNNIPLIKLANEFYDKTDRSAVAEVYGLMERETICHDELGCILINENYDKNKTVLIPKRNRTAKNLAFPYGDLTQKDTVFSAVDYNQVQEGVAAAFDNNDLQKTRSVLVVYKGQIISEKYIDGFSKETPILGWSMTKSVLATLYGILEYRDKIKVDEYFPFSDDTSKEKISLNHLLRMQSSLAWNEDYSGISDVTEMLFLDEDMTLAQAETEAIAGPTAIWNYSSGTSNLLSGILRDQFNTHQEYLDFPYTELIDKIGMYSMLIETDMTGNYVASSYGWASTRDWAKFGLLHLNKGNWNGEQLFHPEWIDYITTPTKHSNGTYGAHWWLNAEGKYPDVPKDLYSANGFQGQRVYIIPSKELVIVRTGLAEPPAFDEAKFLKEIVAAIN